MEWLLLVVASYFRPGRLGYSQISFTIYLFGVKSSTGGCAPRLKVTNPVPKYCICRSSCIFKVDTRPSFCLYLGARELRRRGLLDVSSPIATLPWWVLTCGMLRVCSTTALHRVIQIACRDHWPRSMCIIKYLVTGKQRLGHVHSNEHFVSRSLPRAESFFRDLLKLLQMVSTCHLLVVIYRASASIMLVGITLTKLLV